MLDIRKYLSDYAESKGFKLITETTFGLNVDSDEQVDDLTDAKEELFLNVVENGNLATNQFGSSINVTHNYEIGLFKRCIKENDGDEYYNDIQLLIYEMLELYKSLMFDFDIQSATYETGVDALDSNNVAIKLIFSVVEKLDIC